MMSVSPKGTRQARRAWVAACRKHIKRGKLYHVEFQHDPDCMIYSHEQVCTCNSVRVLKDAQGRPLACIEGAGEYDPLEMVEGVQ
ncbi:hypothetical protein O4H61_20265 [Roseovarius aestuarii]|nr:hypothetical protein [Roseovarius aestuarii]